MNSSHTSYTPTPLALTQTDPPQLFLMSLLRFEFKAIVRSRFNLLVGLLFFAITAILLPLSLPAQNENLSAISPTIIWVILLFSLFLNLELLFAQDYERGHLEVIALSSGGLAPYIALKCVCHWLVTTSPLIILSLPISYSFGTPPEITLKLFITLLLGTPSLTMIGALGASLVLGAKRPTLILIVIITPLILPLLIFSCSYCYREDPIANTLWFLGGYILCLTPTMPLICKPTLKSAILGH